MSVDYNEWYELHIHFVVTAAAAAATAGRPITLSLSSVDAWNSFDMWKWPANGGKLLICLIVRHVSVHTQRDCISQLADIDGSDQN